MHLFAERGKAYDVLVLLFAKRYCCHHVVVLEGVVSLSSAISSPHHTSSPWFV